MILRRPNVYKLSPFKTVQNLAAVKSSDNKSVKCAGEYIGGSTPINNHMHKAVQNKAPSKSSDHKRIFNSRVSHIWMWYTV